MAERKSFLLRIDAHVLDALRRWADDDLRSLNGQIEFLLRDALRARGRLGEAGPGPADSPEPPAPGPGG
jgi:hypothetical protein